jgi:competence protein ComEC
MVEYGFEQKSFQSLNVKIVFIGLFLMALAVWAVALSPDHGGLYPVAFRPTIAVDFVNVGQGDAILIRTPLGKHFLIDGGENAPLGQAKSENRELIQHFLSRNGIRHLDGIVVTHYHNDHLGGIVPVLRQMKVKKIWDPGGDFNTQTFKDYADLCEKRRIPRIGVKAGDTLDWGKELFVGVLHPAEVSKLQDYSAINNTSVTLLLRYGKVSMLLTGDIEEDAEKEVAKYGEAIGCQVMKMPHHGSDTSIYRPFIDLVAPEFGIIMVGRLNPFGHPCPDMLKLYQGLGVQMYRTDHHGTIRLEIGGRDEGDFSIKVDRTT